jgi:hypothetical protein
MGVCAPWFDAADLDCAGSAAPNVVAELALIATDLLYEWSGRRFAGDGACVSTARPGSRGHAHAYYWMTSSAGWGPWSGWGWSGYCGCTHSDRVRLPGAPIKTVTSVHIDGVLLSPAAYRLERDDLVRQDGFYWPACQNHDAPLGAVGTWSVDYTHGAAPPLAGVRAAETLACELLKAVTPGGACSLPSGVTRVVRQGVAYDKLQAAFEMDGRVTTGIALVDAFLGAYNPTGARRRVVIMNPDKPHARRI